MNITQKEEFRYQFAGMAMQAIITNSKLVYSVKNVSGIAHMDFKDAMASIAVEFADALINELEKGNKQ